MSDSCECGDIESCILCRFRQTYINAADAWQAGLAMVKECEALHEENQRLRERVGALEAAHGKLRELMRGDATESLVDDDTDSDRHLGVLLVEIEDILGEIKETPNA